MNLYNHNKLASTLDHLCKKNRFNYTFTVTDGKLAEWNVWRKTKNNLKNKIEGHILLDNNREVIDAEIFALHEILNDPNIFTE